MQSEIVMVERSLERHLYHGQRNGFHYYSSWYTQRLENDTGGVVIKFESWRPMVTRIDNFREPWYFSLLETKKMRKGIEYFQ